MFFLMLDREQILCLVLPLPTHNKLDILENSQDFFNLKTENAETNELRFVSTPSGLPVSVSTCSW